MNKTSRTYKSLKNSGIAMAIFAVNLILQFMSRKVFIDHLGTEILGLNTTATSLLQFLNLAELGIGSAVVSTLYKPLAEQDYKTICEIVSLQGWLYRNIALFVIGGSLLMMFFFPFIFSKSDLPLWYSFTTFGVLLFSSLLGYFVNYKQIVLSANQQEYKVQCSYKVVLSIKVLFQILAIYFLDNGYVWWLILEVLFAVIASFSLNSEIRHTCPYLDTDIRMGKVLRNKYPDVITKIKQLFFHKVAGFVLTQTSPLVIYAYATLTLVAVYGNYMLIVTGILTLLSAIFNGIGASVGNLVASSDIKRIVSVFKELLVSRFFIVSICAYMLYQVSDPFITMWVGGDLLLDKLTLLLIVIFFYLNGMRNVVDSFINAYGLFRDIWAPIVEAIINLVLSITLGYFYGIHGILTGVIISLVVIVFCWKPYFLFRSALRQSITIYIRVYVKLLTIFAVSVSISNMIIDYLQIDEVTNIQQFMLYALSCLFVFGITTLVFLLLFEESMRNFVKRFVATICH